MLLTNTNQQDIEFNAEFQFKFELTSPTRNNNDSCN